MLDVPRDLIWFVSGLLAGHRRQIGTRERSFSWAATGRRCSPWRGSGIRAISRGSAAASGCRSPRRTGTWTEVIEVLAARAPGLQEQLERALAEGVPYLILDGKVVDTDQLPRENPQPQGRGHRFVVRGEDARFRREHPGAVLSGRDPAVDLRCAAGQCADLAAARENVLGMLRPFLDAMPVLADPGYEGAGHGVHVPVKRSPPGSRSWTLIPGPGRAFAVGALPGRARLRAIDPALENAPACHCQPRQNRSHRPRRARPGAIRAQDDHVKVDGKTSLCQMPGETAVQP